MYVKTYLKTLRRFMTKLSAESPMGMLNAVAPWNMELMSSTFEVSHALMFSLKPSKSLKRPLLRVKMQLHLFLSELWKMTWLVQ